MKDIEIVIFNDKSWVRLTEYQKNEEQLTKRIYELQSDLSKAKSQIEKMKCCGNCQTWNEWQCPYARDKEKNYVYPNKNNCPCDKWKIKVEE